MLNMTLSYSQVVVSIALTLIIVVMALGRDEKGLWWYASGFIAIAVSYLLLPLQEKSSPWISIILANLLLIFFHFCMTTGIRIFYHWKPSWPIRFSIYSGLFFVLLVLFTFIFPSFQYRALLMSLTIILLVSEFLAVLLRGSNGTVRTLRYPVMAYFMLCILFHFFRIYRLLTDYVPATTLMTDNPITTFTFTVTLFFTVLWAGGILILDNAKLVSDLVRKNALLENLALKDELTGLFNRHSLDQTIVTEMDRQNRYMQPVSLIMLDLDHFKIVNDKFGHDTGDHILVEAARRVHRGIRSTDFLFRWGGEEFLILMPNTNVEGAALVAEKLRCALMAAPIHPVGTVTASFGVAERKPGEARDEWFHHVDQAMYRAKRDGRNRVETWKGEHEIPFAIVCIEWQKEWDSGFEEIDHEHREMLRLGNELLKLSVSGKKKAEIKKGMTELIQTIQSHFQAEELILAEAKYPDLERHRSTHNSIYTQALELQESFVKGKTEPSVIFDFIMHTIILDHMLTADIQFFPYLRNRTSAR